MNPSFTETQKFNKWWHYLIAGLPIFLISIPFIFTYLGILPPKNNVSSNNLLFIATVTIGSVISFFIWFIILQLKTNINKEGIQVHFFGIPFAKKNINWSEIQSIAIVKYSPLSDYGGWGVRYSLTGNGWCYNVSGSDGIKLIRTNGKPLLIGTQQKEEAEKIINLYFKK